jgi:hypothetical protein
VKPQPSRKLDYADPAPEHERPVSVWYWVGMATIAALFAGVSAFGFFHGRHR